MQKLLFAFTLLISLCGWAIAAPLAAGAELVYQLARPMRVSINVYDSKGEIVRSLRRRARAERMDRELA